MFHEVRPTIPQLINAISPSSSFSQTNGQRNENTTPNCPVCGKTFKNRGSRKFHLLKLHNIREETIEDLLGIKSGNERQLRIFCPFEECKLIKRRKNYFQSVKLLVQHFQKVHYEKKLKCSDCSAKFALDRDLCYHRKKVIIFGIFNH